MMILASLLAAAGIAAADPGAWPQFRGPSGDGHAPPAARPLPTEWSETRNVTWKTAIAHKGWSTPVTAHGRIWLTAATPDGRDYFVFAANALNGKLEFEAKLFHSDHPEPLGNDVNGYASPSPLADGDRVFVHFGSYGTAALDARTGSELWRRTDLPCRHFRGPGSSLAHFGDTLILTMDGVDQQYLVALDKGSGKTVWRTDRTTDFGDLGPDGKPQADGDLRKAYTTPLVLDRDSPHPWFISIGAKAAYAYDARDGTQLWNVTYPGFSNASSPVYARGLAIINTGYGKANLLAFKADARTRGTIEKSQMVWECLKRVPQRSTPVVFGDHLYMVDDGGFCSCLELKTGEVRWSERLEGNYSASPIIGSGRVYFFSEQGDGYVINPSPEKLTVAAHNKLENGMLASPAVTGGSLLLRTKSHLYRIDAR